MHYFEAESEYIYRYHMDIFFGHFWTGGLKNTRFGVNAPSARGESC